jgi:predicted unusual protein kinase regulating ubiquinone biosynthesis (AarF/ABC1/UbiB family)
MDGFIHGDLHCGNILLKPIRQDTILYGNKILQLNKLQAVIMDFEKSKINQKNKMIFVIRDIKRLFNTISDMTSNKFDINYDYNRLTTLLSDLDESKNYY